MTVHELQQPLCATLGEFPPCEREEERPVGTGDIRPKHG